MAKFTVQPASSPKGSFSISTPSTAGTKAFAHDGSNIRTFKSEAAANKWLKAQNGKDVQVHNPNTNKSGTIKSTAGGTGDIKGKPDAKTKTQAPKAEATKASTKANAKGSTKSPVGEPKERVTPKKGIGTSKPKPQASVKDVVQQGKDSVGQGRSTAGDKGFYNEDNRGNGKGKPKTTTKDPDGKGKPRTTTRPMRKIRSSTPNNSTGVRPRLSPTPTNKVGDYAKQAVRKVGQLENAIDNKINRYIDDLMTKEGLLKVKKQISNLLPKQFRTIGNVLKTGLVVLEKTGVGAAASAFAISEILNDITFRPAGRGRRGDPGGSSQAPALPIDLS